MQRSEIDGYLWEHERSGGGGGTLTLLTGGGPAPEGMLDAIGDGITLLRVAPPTGAPLAAVVAGVPRLLDRLEVGPTHLLGASITGGVAQCVVRRAPGRIASLILANTGPPTRWAAPLAALGAAVVRRLPRRWIERRMAAGLGGAVGVRRDDLVGWLRWTADYHRAGPFAPDDLDGWDGRVLLLESDDDPGVPASARRRMRGLYPGARVHTFRGGGHAPALSRPEEFATVVRGFLHVAGTDAGTGR